MALYQYSSEDYIFQGASWDEIRAGGVDLSKFDEKLRSSWDALMDAGYFRYSLDHTRQRIISGPERYITDLNLKRGTQRRVPEKIESLNMPYNPDKFNFTKVKKEEIIFELVQGKRAQNSNPSNGHPEAANPTESHANAVNGKNGSTSKHSGEGRHILLINVSPLGYGHSLVVCDSDEKIHQKMTLTSHKMAIETVLLSNHPGFRVGFNSLCALASVNHQHFHTWYMDEPLTIESAPTKQLCHGLYEMVNKPTRAFVLQLYGHTVDEIARIAFMITDFYQKNDVAHNVFLTRGPAIGGKEGECTVKVYIWPRKSVVGIKNESGGTIFNVAVAELAGFIPVYDKEEFDHITESKIIEIIQSQLLSDDQFDSLRDQMLTVIQKEAKQ